VSTLAINWQPELRGILTVIIAVGTLMGSVYLILGTNMGARLGFLVAFSALAGWIFIMSAVWWTYGIGLKGPDVTWKPVVGKAVLQDVPALNSSGAIGSPITIADGTAPLTAADQIDQSLVAQGWKKLADSAPAFGQAGSSASGFIVTSGAFGAATDFKVVSVFDKGGQAYPKVWKIDQLAFWHHPYTVLVEVAPLVKQRSEPGRAPAAAQIDPARPHQYVYMYRDLGAKREPAASICIGSLIVFLTTCWLLHRRDKIVAVNRGQLALPAKA
jgi:hypothetical protein